MYGLYSVSWGTNRNISLYYYIRSRVRLRNSYFVYNGLQHSVTFQIRDWNDDEDFDRNSNKDREQHCVILSVADSNVLANDKWYTHGDTVSDSNTDAHVINHDDSIRNNNINRLKHSVKYKESLEDIHRDKVEHRIEHRLEYGVKYSVKYGDFIKNNHHNRFYYGVKYSIQYCDSHTIEHENKISDCIRYDRQYSH